jgi:hypothetical protein
MDVKRELYRKVEMYHRLSVMCDVALMLLVLLIGITALGIESGDITWKFFVITAGLIAVAGMVLLVKRIAWVQQKSAADRLARREAWEQGRDICCATPLDELKRDFRRYFGGKLPETTRSGRMLDHIKLEDGEPVDQAVKHWLFMSGYPHIGLWYCEDGEWKFADGEELNGEVIVFERRMVGDSV